VADRTSISVPTSAKRSPAVKKALAIGIGSAKPIARLTP
jgi:hypothetical protein